MLMPQKYRSLNEFLRNRYGCRVQKIAIDANFTCPNRDGTIARGGCIYCNARGSGTGAARHMSVKDQIIRGKQGMFLRYKAKKFLVYFQAHTNTYAPIQTLKELYDQALSIPGIVGLCIGTRPDCISDDVLNLLQSYAKDYLIWIEYGLQSMHNKTLDFINRGHHFDAFKEAILATQNRGILTCAHIILGLPNETREHVIQTTNAVANLKVDSVKPHLLYVVKDTPMEKLYRQGLYKCLYPSQYADWVCDVIERLPPETIIQRLTGEPHSHELVAPTWTLNKRALFAQIHKRLEERETYQGKFLV